MPTTGSPNSSSRWQPCKGEQAARLSVSVRRKMVTTKSAELRENQGAVKIDLRTRKVELTILPTL